MTTDDAIDTDVPPEFVARLRPISLGLPETYEEQAWIGTRWRIRKRTFAHVLPADPKWLPGYARSSAADGPVTVLTFHSPPEELHALVAAGDPFYKPQWSPTIVALMLDHRPGLTIDWEEIAELVTESYCLLAPKKLAGQVHRPVA